VLDEALVEVERDGYAAMVVVDLRVVFGDAAGLGLLVSWHYALRGAGGVLVLTTRRRRCGGCSPSTTPISSNVRRALGSS
jgi:anti-anti-sigma regulatory factor